MQKTNWVLALLTISLLCALTLEDLNQAPTLSIWKKSFPSEQIVTPGDKIVHPLSEYLDLEQMKDIEIPETCKNVIHSHSVGTEEVQSLGYVVNNVTYKYCDMITSTASGKGFYVLCEKKHLLYVVLDDKNKKIEYLADLTSPEISNSLVKSRGCFRMKVLVETNELVLACYGSDAKSTKLQQPSIPNPKIAILILKETFNQESQRLSITKVDAKSYTASEDSELHILSPRKQKAKIILVSKTQSPKPQNPSLSQAGKMTPLFVVISYENSRLVEAKGTLTKGEVSADLPSWNFAGSASSMKALYLAYLNDDNKVFVTLCVINDQNQYRCEIEQKSNNIVVENGKFSFLAVPSKIENETRIIIATTKFVQTYDRIYKENNDGNDGFETDSREGYFIAPESLKYNFASIDGAFVAEEIMYLTGIDTEGKPVLHSFVDRNKKFVHYENTLPDKTPGKLFLKVDNNKSGDEDLIHLQSMKIVLRNVNFPTIEIRVDEKTKDSINLKEFSCKIKATLRNGKSEEITFMYQVLIDMKKVLAFTIPETMEIYPNNPTVIPMYNTDFEGNAPVITFRIPDNKDGFEAGLIYADKLNVVKSWVAQTPKTTALGQQPIKYTNRAITHIADDYYFIKDDKNNVVLIVSCTMTDLAKNLECKEIRKVNYAQISNGLTDDWKIKDSVKLGAYFFFVVSEKSEGKLVYFKKDDSSVLSTMKIDREIQSAVIRQFSDQTLVYILNKEGIFYIRFTVQDSYSTPDFKVMKASEINRKLCPVKIMYYPEGNTRFSVLSNCNKVSTIFNLEFTTEKPNELRLFSTIDLTEFKDPFFCATTNYVMVVDKELESLKPRLSAFDHSMDDGSEFRVNLNDFNSIEKVLQLECQKQGNMIHMLTQSNGNKKYVVSLNENNNGNPKKRIHSIVEVEDDTTEISSGFNFKEVEDMVYYGAKTTPLEFKAIGLHPDGPRVVVTGKKEGVVILESIMTGLSGETMTRKTTITVIAQKKVATEMTATKPLIIKEKGLINLNNYFTFNGPVFKMEYNPAKKDDKNTNKMLDTWEKVTDLSTPYATMAIAKYFSYSDYDVIQIGENTIDSEIQFYKSRKIVEISNKKGDSIKGKILAATAESVPRPGDKDGKIDTYIFLLVATKEGQKIFCFYPSAGKKEKLLQQTEVKEVIEDVWTMATSDTLPDNYQDLYMFGNIGEEYSGSFTWVSYNNYERAHVQVQLISIQGEEGDVLNIGTSGLKHYFNKEVHSISALEVEQNLVIFALVGNYRQMAAILVSRKIDSSAGYVEKRTELYDLTNGKDIKDGKYRIEHEDSLFTLKKVNASDRTIIRGFIATRSTYHHYVELYLNKMEDVLKNTMSLIISDKSKAKPVASIPGFYPSSIHYLPNILNNELDLAAVTMLRHTASTPSLLRQQIVPRDEIDLSKESVIFVLYSSFDYPINVILGSTESATRSSIARISTCVKQNAQVTFNPPKGLVYGVVRALTFDVQDSSLVNLTADSFKMKALSVGEFIKLPEKTEDGEGDPKDKTPIWKNKWAVIGGVGILVVLIAIFVVIAIVSTKKRSDDDTEYNEAESIAITEDKYSTL